MSPDNFPSLNTVKSGIRKLEKKVFPVYREGVDVELFVKEITNEVFKEFDFVFNAVQPTKCNQPFLDFFRVRAYDTFSNINLIREHSYPPIDRTGMGRCNFPKFPVFYCSNDIGTALLEVVRNTNSDSKKYCISKWKLIQSEEELFFENFLQIQLPKENHFNILKENISQRIKEPFEREFNKQMNNDQEAGLLEYLKYLHNCFIQDKDYSLSAALAYRTLFAPHNCRTDILMYPSVQSMFKGVNMAINPNFVENNLKLARLYVVEFEAFKPDIGEMSINISSYAEVEKNVVIWKKINPDSEEYNKAINEDFQSMFNSEFRKK